MKAFSLCSLIILLALTTCPAQDKDFPDTVTRGFETYKRDGVLAAVNVWFAGSARETDDAIQDEAVARFSRVQSSYGRMLGFEPIRVVILSRSTRRIYVAVKFEKGIAWMSFDSYLPEKDWIVTRFDFSTNANVILPPNILGGQ